MLLQFSEDPDAYGMKEPANPPPLRTSSGLSSMDSYTSEDSTSCSEADGDETVSYLGGRQGLACMMLHVLGSLHHTFAQHICLLLRQAQRSCSCLRSAALEVKEFACIRLLVMCPRPCFFCRQPQRSGWRVSRRLRLVGAAALSVAVVTIIRHNQLGCTQGLRRGAKHAPDAISEGGAASELNSTEPKNQPLGPGKMPLACCNAGILLTATQAQHGSR